MIRRRHILTFSKLRTYKKVLFLFCFFFIQNAYATDDDDCKTNHDHRLLLSPSSEATSLPEDIFGESISFSSSGFHFFYHLGVARFLQENYDLSRVRFLATSGGCLAAMMLALDIPFQETWDACYPKVYEAAQKRLTGPLFNLVEIGKEVFFPYLESVRKKDFYKTVSGRVILSSTVMEWGFFPRNTRFSHWHSNDGVIDSMTATSQIPFFINKSLFCAVNGKWHIDGALTDNQPIIDENTVRVSPYMWSNLWRIGGLRPRLHEEDNLKLVAQGYKDAAANPKHWGRLEKYRKPSAQQVRSPL